MPKINVEKVVSFSSEDPLHVAQNILSADQSKKWKCQNVGEKSVSVVLQLEKPSIISSIDMGNENSAYIEVLVSRSSSSDDYKVLLVMSSFMTPMEARQSTNINKVRLFSYKQLSSPERDEKWDRVKVVCTQPFNRHVQYGLSFVNFYSTDGKTEEPDKPTIGNFTIRSTSPDIPVGSLFARRKDLDENKDNSKVTAAAAIRNATATITSQSPANKNEAPSPASTSTTKNPPNASSRNRDELLYTKDEDDYNEKIDELVKKKNEEKEKTQKVNQDQNTRKVPPGEKKGKKMNTGTNNDLSKVRTPKKNTTPKKRKLDSEDSVGTAKKPRKTKSFYGLLDDVVLVISGIENPERANIRNTALLMGARYKGNWDNTCTHLICAFTNTPKFNQVRGKGKIVTKQWIHDCGTQRKRLPWRRYALDKRDQGKPESEDEIFEEVNEPEQSTSTSSASSKPSARKKELASDSEDDNDHMRNGSDVHENKGSGNDTEDEIEKIQKARKVNGDKSTEYDRDTDDDDFNVKANSRNHFTLPNFLTGKKFYIDQNLSKHDKFLLVKYITAYNGSLIKDSDKEIDIIITNQEHSTLFKESTADVLSANFVWECHNTQSLVSTEKFKI